MTPETQPHDLKGHLRSAPTVTTIAAALVGWLIAPHLGHATAAEFGTLFATCAQVAAGLLVVIAVQVTFSTFRGLDLRASDIKSGLLAACLSVASGVAALSPSLASWLYRPLLAVTVAGALGSLVTVVIVGFKVIDQAHEEAERAAKRRRAMLGDEAARQELLAEGQ